MSVERRRNRKMYPDGYRDRPISFQWLCSSSLTQALGLVLARKPAEDAARRMILAEALLAAESDRGVSYSRRKLFYSQGRQYRATAYTYVTVLDAIASLVGEGWLSEHRALPNARGWQSSFRATPALLSVAWGLAAQLTFAQHETIRLKDEAGNLLDYRATRQTDLLHRMLEPLNACLADLKIELPAAVRQRQHLRIGNSVILPLPGNGLRRIFSCGSFACHGRAYGWWQNIPRTERSGVLINGESTAEADYAAMHISILYGERGIRFSGDPYSIDDFPRDLVKQGFNIAVNADVFVDFVKFDRGPDSDAHLADEGGETLGIMQGFAFAVPLLDAPGRQDERHGRLRH